MSWVKGGKGWLKGYVRPRKAGLDAAEDAKDDVKPPEDETFPIVTVRAARCPKESCRSKDVMCYKTALPIRYHKCNLCGSRFKTLEVD